MYKKRKTLIDGKINNKNNKKHIFLFFIIVVVYLLMFGYELDKLLYNYDYGIVPGSATIFVRDEVQKTVKMDLTLLENIMVIIEITNEGYKVNNFII